MMCRFTCLLLSCVLILMTACKEQNKTPQEYMESAIKLYHEQRDTGEIIGVLSEGIALYPENLPLIQFSTTLYCEQGMLAECRTSTVRLLELKPDLIEASTMLCMLDEFEGAGQEQCDVCYGAFLPLFDARFPAATPELEVANKATYVFTLFMARHPDAEKEKQALFARVAEDSSLTWLYQGMFENFDRRKVLRGIFNKNAEK